LLVFSLGLKATGGWIVKNIRVERLPSTRIDNMTNHGTLKVNSGCLSTDSTMVFAPVATQVSNVVTNSTQGEQEIWMCDDRNNSNRKISDAITYGPRFCELFHMFVTECKLQFNISRHLLSLILYYLITFIRWARQDEDRIDNISKLLLNYNYLRVGTRNGVVIVIIYLFASIKSTVIPYSDMFSVQMSDNYGLGITNKFSLKIYNDPYYFLTFLKLCVSALIDIGAIPENTRSNNVLGKCTGRCQGNKQIDDTE
jgi:hypothetical protein